ncbi:MAG: hypothetical protein JWO36_4144 [Myxococcales bacterium]|nr:hypothetical protein [Myxococcales bacterium]
MRYADAVAELYQTPHPSFVPERKRLAGELKAAGDREGAAKLAKLPRPPISAWVVNQLYWHARDAFEALMKTADKLRGGDLGATGKHREAMAALRERAAAMLGDAGHAATESTLRRVTQTLSALAANGGFEPDLPGTLAEDRDPPGFEAIGISSGKPKPVPEKHEPPAKHTRKSSETHGAHDGHAKKSSETYGAHDELKAAREAAAAKAKQREHEQAAKRAQELAEKKREEQVRVQKAAERHRIEAALRTAEGEVASRERQVAALKKQLRDAEHAVDTAKKIAKDLARTLDD